MSQLQIAVLRLMNELSEKKTHDLKWITTGGGKSAETGEGKGRHIQLDTTTGIITKGFGAGKTLKEAFNPEPKTDRQKLGRKIAEAGAKKHGGDERQYRNLGVTKGQADSFAREYLKSGEIPEGHLREALEDKSKTASPQVQLKETDGVIGEINSSYKAKQIDNGVHAGSYVLTDNNGKIINFDDFAEADKKAKEVGGEVLRDKKSPVIRIKIPDNDIHSKAGLNDDKSVFMYNISSKPKEEIDPSLSGLKALAEQYGEKKAVQNAEKPEEKLNNVFSTPDNPNEESQLINIHRLANNKTKQGFIDGLKNSTNNQALMERLGVKFDGSMTREQAESILEKQYKNIRAETKAEKQQQEIESKKASQERMFVQIQAQSEPETNPNNNVKPKKLSITRMPSLNTIAEHATKGWNTEKLSDDELAKALMYNRAAQTMRLNNDIIAKIPFSKRHSLSGAASKDLENKILAEYKKRGLDDKYEFDVNVLPKSEKSQQNTQSNAFTPTHESATSEPLHHIEGNIYRDEDGNEVEDNYASEIKA